MSAFHFLMDNVHQIKHGCGIIVKLITLEEPTLWLGVFVWLLEMFYSLEDQCKNDQL